MWLGRYIERSEDTVRILRAYHVRLAETSDPDMPLLADIRDYLEPYRHRRRGGHSGGADRLAGQRRLQRRADPRPLLARRLAGAARPVEDHPPLRRGGRAGRRRHARHDRDPAQARRLFGPAAGEHVPLHRLALPGDRPAAGTRHPDRPLARLADARGRAGRSARHDAGDRRQRDDPSPPIRARRAAQPGRPPGARPAQPALGAVPARPAEARDRASARDRRPGASVAGGEGRAEDPHRAGDRRARRPVA